MLFSAGAMKERRGKRDNKERINNNSNANGWHVYSGTRDPFKQERIGDIFVQGPILFLSLGFSFGLLGFCFVNLFPTSTTTTTTTTTTPQSHSSFSPLFFLPRGQPIASFLPFS